ncbi:hypothetical protein [Clostridium tetani]|nr:hypothetical protein [Clostridium tetani]
MVQLYIVIVFKLDSLGVESKVEELANTLQVGLDSGAKKVLPPLSSRADL